ncbi:MAG: carboxy-S-adenosyl-L-methionine synthase CmoA [Candidatus Omnitrophica bacterium]|nr:carboxy-S-adenosyl-L-methionine synthase CmoA [Candidatus Omnitrophota bacterium]
MKKDDLYSQPLEIIGDFVFDERVANIFTDMIQRSVPGYNVIIGMIGVLAEQYVCENSCCYDLGCSLGAATMAMRQKTNKENVKIIAVDNSPAMIKKCQENLTKASAASVELLCDDICNVEIKNASMVVLNFTLQFVELEQRERLLGRIYQGVRPGGVIVISEKIIFEDKDEQNFQTKLYENFKKLNGYSDLEIAQKRTALEKVLIPDTLKEHQRRLERVGFQNFYVWFQCFNFVSMVAVK